MSDLPPIDPNSGYEQWHEFDLKHPHGEGRYFEFSVKIPGESLSHRLFRFSCWLKRVAICSWRGHDRWVSPFFIYCNRCRCKLPPPNGEWTAHWVIKSGLEPPSAPRR